MNRFVYGVLCLTLAPAPLWSQGIVQTIPAPPVTDWLQSAFWETVDGKPNETSWEFVDSEIRLVHPRGGKGSLISGPLPPHFDLSWQWKIDAKTNTGLKYRVRKFRGRWLGVEYQIIDEPNTSLSKGSTASIYNLVGIEGKKTTRPPGQWNDARVVAHGNTLQHYLNGQLVASAETVGPEWERSIALSKFYGEEDFGLARKADRVMLTDHGGKAAYRNFRFRELPAPSDEPDPTPAARPQLANSIRNGWADQDSIVLWTRTTRNAEMNADGPRFLQLKSSEVKQLAKSEDAAEIEGRQVPEGAELSEMFAACPGAPGEVRLTYFPKLKRHLAVVGSWQKTASENDFTMQWELDELQGDTEYAAVVEARPIGSEQLTAVVRGSFRTAPTKTQRKDLRFCVTTCHDFLRRDDGMRGHKIYRAMSDLSPHFMVHAGDVEYYDKPEPWAMTVPLMRFKWNRIFALPENRRFYENTTSYFIKDDHDTLKNDCWVGQRYGPVTFARGVELFNDEQFPSAPVRYKTVRWGRDLQIWLLEGRDFRSPNDLHDGPQKTILGEEQKAWLFRTLSDSDAAFKIIFSPTPVVGPDRDKKRDNHANDTFAHEGAQVRGELAKHDNVIVLCGDRHWQYASVDSETGLWEFGCGPGSEKHQLGWKKGDERPTHQFLRVAGGFLSGDLKQDSDGHPQLTLRHRTVSGKQVSKFVFPQE